SRGHRRHQETRNQRLYCRSHKSLPIRTHSRTHGPTLPPPRGYSSRHYFHCTRRNAALQVILGGFDSGGLVGVVPRPRKIPPDLEQPPLGGSVYSVATKHSARSALSSP